MKSNCSSYWIVCLLSVFAIKLSSQVIVVKPYLQNGSHNSMTIMWEADDSGDGQIDFGLTPFNLNQSQTSVTQLGSGLSQIHTAVLTGLSNKTKYYYKASMEDGQESTLYSFVTLDHPSAEQSVQLVAISDMQRDGSQPDKFKEIVEDGIIPMIEDEIGPAISDLEAVLIPGDLVVTGGNYPQWQNDFFNKSDSLFPYVPLYPVPGNHEYSGGGLPNFIKYFTLPENGVVGLEEECWYKDISNIRVIGLNSNSGASDQISQLDWLGSVLDQTCNEEKIDFVFAELHHPYKSELWTPGENDFTGMVIDSLQAFTTECNIPSIHFFGHTHGYSRGQSRDHKHLWVNVATAGGAIDNWGEFPNADYPEFVKSQDEYGFVLIEADAGVEPQFTLRRFSRGDQDVVVDNLVTDELTIYKHEYPPIQPSNIYPSDADTISSFCMTLKASEFSGVRDSIQASHWEIALSDNFVDSLVTTDWYQNENFYNEINTQADDDLTDSEYNTLSPGQTYYWRVRYRDQSLEWSDWSASTSFFYESSVDTLSPNLIVNGGAEDGINDWVGDIESLENAECNSVSPYLGSHNFGVGGICVNEMDIGIAYQVADLTPYSGDINAGMGLMNFGGYLRDYSGSDIPEMYVKFFDASNILLSTSHSISNANPNWMLIETAVAIPVNTVEARITLKGTRNSGSDNDSYFDELKAYILQGSCQNCLGESGNDVDGDGFCDDIDCDDNNEMVYPGALEICDGIDNNCDGVFDTNTTIIWTGNGSDDQWGNAQNWDQLIVPLPCQFVSIQNSDSVIVDGVFACKGIDAGANCSVNILEGSYLNIDSKNESGITPACINGLLFVDGKWEVR